MAIATDKRVAPHSCKFLVWNASVSERLVMVLQLFLGSQFDPGTSEVPPNLSGRNAMAGPLT
ncbi:MAG TPA: hypothetical protein VMU81_05565 [Acetobacteraceae bacterium]|nr:hypothetical protein [Acetobacteraceae bacterium]